MQKSINSELLLGEDELIRVKSPPPSPVPAEWYKNPAPDSPPAPAPPDLPGTRKTAHGHKIIISSKPHIPRIIIS